MPFGTKVLVAVNVSTCLAYLHILKVGLIRAVSGSSGVFPIFALFNCDEISFGCRSLRSDFRDKETCSGSSEPKVDETYDRT